jgi:bacterioferritin-associated ferredoxin
MPLAAKTILCRCEDVSDRDLDAARARHPIVSLEDLKRHTRITMGPCQGRICRGWVARYWDAAHAEGPRNGHEPNSVADLPHGAVTIPGHRPPVRPVLVRDIAALHIDEEAPWAKKDLK